MTRLDHLLRTLHVHGYWIGAWYPIHDAAEFECRINCVPNQPSILCQGWGVHTDPLEALAIAMRKAELPTEDWDEDTEADNPGDQAAAADFYDQIGGGHD